MNCQTARLAEKAKSNGQPGWKDRICPEQGGFVPLWKFPVMKPIGQLAGCKIEIIQVNLTGKRVIRHHANSQIHGVTGKNL